MDFYFLTAKENLDTRHAFKLRMSRQDVSEDRKIRMGKYMSILRTWRTMVNIKGFGFCSSNASVEEDFLFLPHNFFFRQRKIAVKTKGTEEQNFQLLKQHTKYHRKDLFFCVFIILFSFFAFFFARRIYFIWLKRARCFYNNFSR